MQLLTPDVVGNDIVGVVVYSFADCLRACASHNYITGQDECKAVFFTADMQNWIEQYAGNCFLKNATTGKITDQDDLRATALLVSSG